MKSPSRLLGYALGILLTFTLWMTVSTQSVADVSYPAAGTYRLDRIQHASSGLVLEDNNWRPHLLSSYFSGQITLFSFFYAMCRDPLGCPAAWSAFEEVKSRIERDPRLHGRVRLVFLSLDPRTDTPEQLSFFRGKSTADVPWNFLTTWSRFFLQPILENMGIVTVPDRDENGKRTGQINHMLKVFLIDKDGWVREIYTTSFLNPDVIMNDIRTLEMETH